MPIVRDEQKVKRPSQFLQYKVGTDGNSLILKSHLYKIDTHFVKSIRRSVICMGDECSYCKKGYRTKSEFNYMVDLNGEKGFIDIKPSVFYSIQGISRAQKKDPRQISWTVIKTGEGLSTEYTVSKDDNLEKDVYKKINDELDDSTSDLEKVMLAREEQLKQGYYFFEEQVGAIEEKKPIKEEPPIPEEPR